MLPIIEYKSHFNCEFDLKHLYFFLFFAIFQGTYECVIASLSPLSKTYLKNGNRFKPAPLSYIEPINYPSPTLYLLSWSNMYLNERTKGPSIRNKAWNEAENEG